jgi:hypothetical protein
MNEQQYQGPERRQAQSHYMGVNRRRPNGAISTQDPMDEPEERIPQQPQKRDELH